MFIAHLPAGYIFTKILQKRWKVKRYLGWGLLGSVFPDFDLLYFYLIDGRQTLHHEYWIHIPFYWLLVACVVYALIYASGRKKYLLPATFFLLGILLHLILDTVVGHILWLYPFTDRAFYLFEVPAVHEFWVYNFIFHWTFLFEIIILLWALILLFRPRFSRVRS